jgi:DNA-binding transcriptional regulator YhcF (GntR family)
MVCLGMAADPSRFQLDRAGDAPLGAQLAAKLRGLIEAGELAPGDGLPSLRAMAQAAAVNVNTVRAVYSKLENDGLVQTEHGRGTYVARPGTGRVARRELRRQIALLEAALAAHPPPPSEAPGARGGASTGAGLLSELELEEVRDRLRDRLFELDRQRAEVLRRLEHLEEPEAAAGRPSTPSVSGARIRWVGIGLRPAD